MTRVSIRLFAGAAEAFGGAETELEGVSDLADLVERLSADRDERLREILDQCSYFIDGEHCSKLDTPVPPGSRVDVLPPFAGG